MSALRALVIKIAGFLISIVTVFPLVVFRVFKQGWQNVFQAKSREQPSCLNSTQLGQHGYIRTSTQIQIHYVEKGDRSKPLMLFLHGFPEFWYSWRYQMDYFSSREFWCVAMDLRGYNDSEKPKGIKSYAMEYLVSDVKDVIEGLGAKSCILVGHDWGGAIGYAFVAKWPSMVKKYIAINIPHPQSHRRELANSWKQRLMSWYILAFQCPYLPEIFIASSDFSMLDGIIKDAKGDKFMAEAYKYAFRNPASITAAVNYYRCAIQYPNIGSNMDISVPVVSIFGTGDKYLSVEAAKGSKDFIKDFTLKFLNDVGHWSHMERPDLVNHEMEEALRNIK